MKNKIKNIIKDHVKLIEPLIENGTTSAIGPHAEDEYNKLISVTLDNELDENDFIKKYKNDIIVCCSSLFNKLSEDSRQLPTVELRNLAKKESDNVMNIWTNIERKKINS